MENFGCEQLWLAQKITSGGHFRFNFDDLFWLSGMMRFEFYFQFYKESNLLPNIFLAKWRNK